jgi:DNA-binding NarL/FixJ family response regulator
MRDLRIGIVEDNRELRESLQEIVKSAPGLRCVCAYGNAEDAILNLPKHSPDLVLMDIHLPVRSGIECTRRLKDLCPQLQVLILTVYEDNESIFNALKAGASGYLLKRSSPAEILAAIADVNVGGAPMSSQIARQVIASFRAPAPTLEPEGEPLSEREKEVLGYLTKGYSGKEIADKMHVSFNTIKTHMRHVYQKLHVRSRTEILLRFHAAPPPGA